MVYCFYGGQALMVSNEIAEIEARLYAIDRKPLTMAAVIFLDTAVTALCATVKHLRNKTCPDCVTVAPDGSGYCRTCDSFTMPSDFSLRWVRRTQLEDLQSQLEQLRAELTITKQHRDDLIEELRKL